MFAELERAEPRYRPSAFWERLNAAHLDTLVGGTGFAHFKRTLNDTYFQFGFYAFPRSLPLLLSHWARHPDPSVFGARFDPPAAVRLGRLLARRSRSTPRPWPGARTERCSKRSRSLH